MAFHIADALAWAKHQLTEVDNPLLEARILLCHSLGVEQTYLLTWPEKPLDDEQKQRFESLLEERASGKPIAHIIGYRDFWDLRLKVNDSTLIPRPETEMLVECALDLDLPDNINVLDLGTGTGAVALSLAAERQAWSVLGLDRVESAVDLAWSNAKANGIENCKFLQSHWFSEVNDKYELIVSNPPYVESNSHYLSEGDVQFEPHSALTSGEDGLNDIRYIVSQAPKYLTNNAWLALEHGYQQAEPITQLLEEAGFSHIQTLLDLNKLPRITFAQYKFSA